MEADFRKEMDARLRAMQSEAQATIVEHKMEIMQAYEHTETALQAAAIEMRRRFDHVSERFDDVNERFDDINERFRDVNERFDGVDERFKEVNGRFDDVNVRLDKVTEGLHLCEAKFSEVNARLIETNARIDMLRSDMTARIEAASAHLVKWMVGLVFTSQTLTFGIAAVLLNHQIPATGAPAQVQQQAKPALPGQSASGATERADAGQRTPSPRSSASVR